MVLYLSPSTKHLTANPLSALQWEMFSRGIRMMKAKSECDSFQERYATISWPDALRVAWRRTITWMIMDLKSGTYLQDSLNRDVVGMCWYRKDRSLPHFSSPVVDPSKEMSSKSQWMISNGITTCGHEFKGYMKEKRVNGLPAPEDMWYTSRMRLLV